MGFLNRFVTILVNQKTMRLQLLRGADVNVITDKDRDQLGLRGQLRKTHLSFCVYEKTG